MIDGGAVAILVSAIERHTASGVVLHGAAGGLRNLAVNPKNRKKILDAGGVAALDAAMGHHAENEMLHNELQYAKSVVLGEKPPPAAVAAAAAAAEEANRKRSERKNTRSSSPLARAITSGKKKLTAAISAKPLRQEGASPISAKPLPESSAVQDRPPAQGSTVDSAAGKKKEKKGGGFFSGLIGRKSKSK